MMVLAEFFIREKQSEALAPHYLEAVGRIKRRSALRITIRTIVWDERYTKMACRLWATRAASYMKISAPYRGYATVLKDLKYADSHEWAKIDGKIATVGITDHAQDHLGDVVYVELPEVGVEVKLGESFGAVESVKATSDINSPVSGKVTEVNEVLNSTPGTVNGSPYDKGWIIKVEVSDRNEVSSLMDSDEYSKFCEEEDAKH